MIPPNPDEVIQAAAMTPAFIGAYTRAPASVTVDGRTYSRDAARNAQERVWYLAACSLKNPRAVHNLAYLGVDEMARGLDEHDVADDSGVITAKQKISDAGAAVRAAQGAVTQAQTDYDKVKRDASAVQHQIEAQDAQTRDLEARIADMGRVKDAGDFLGAVVTMGGSKLVPYAEAQVRLGSSKNHAMQLRADLSKYDVDGAKAALDSTKDTLRQAKKAEKAAQAELVKADNAVRARLRAAEEEVAQKQADQDKKEAAAADAQRRKDAADAAANTASDYASSEYSGEEDVQWGSGDFATTDPNADLGEPDFLDMQDQADLWGDEDLAVMMMEDTDEPMIGVNTVISPYSFDRYYSEYNLSDDDPVWGADTGQVVTGIIAGVLAAAPAIMKAIAPPPSADTSAADGSSTVDVDGFLQKVGVKKTINDAAAAAGASAGTKGGEKAGESIDRWLWVGALVIGGVVLAKVL